MKTAVSISRFCPRWWVLLWVLMLAFPLCVCAGGGAGGSAPEADGGATEANVGAMETNIGTMETDSTADAGAGARVGGKRFSPSDVVLTNMFETVARHSATVQQYQAQMYMRAQYKVHKRNALIRLVPSMFKFYDGVSDYLTETVSEVQYVAPDVYHMKLRALSGTFRRNQAGLYNALDYLNVNAYSPTLLPDRLISPFNEQAVKYYHFYLDSVAGPPDSLRYCIRVVPKHKGTQLVSGSFVLSHGTWLIRELTLSGRIELVDFTLCVRMGTEGAEQLLPKQFDVKLMFRFLWNKIESDYSARFDYRDIIAREEGEPPVSDSRSDKYDLTRAYLLKCDDSEVSFDTALVAAARPEPLTAGQQRIYADFNARRRAQTAAPILSKSRSRAFWGNVSDVLVGSYTLDAREWGRFRFSPLLDPGMVSYSHSNGFSYKQQFNYNRLFRNDRVLQVRPKAGYNFTRKELYWSADVDYYYDPSRMGALTFKVGNGNRIYTSRVMDELRENGDSLVNFDKLHLNYFKDTYVQVGNRIELANGLQLFVGADMHRRKAVRPSELVVKDHLQRPTSISLRPTYVTFAPRVKLTWTPGQYYYMDGNRKVYLHSHFPTLSIDYERGIKGILGSNGSYGRIEADVQQRVRLSAVSNLYYRYGGGLFTEQKSVYFVDFANFTRSYLPMGWSDDISGAFHLLDNDWYNSSRWYSRAHLAYEAPFIVLPHSRKYNGIVHSERLYFSTLFTTHLHPYVEVGYGIGTYLFNLGVFASNVNGQFHEVGCKFTFELFSGR